MSKSRRSLRSSWTNINAVGLAIRIQWLAALLAVAIGEATRPDVVKSMAYGLGVALLVSMYLLRRMKKAQRSEFSMKDSLRQVQHTAVGRIIIAAVLLALPALHKMHFLYWGVIMGFVIGQMGWLLGLAYVQVRAARD